MTELDGQWLGKAAPSDTEHPMAPYYRGLLTLNIDPRVDGFLGTAIFLPNDMSLPAWIGEARLEEQDGQVRGRVVNITPVDPTSWCPVLDEETKEKTIAHYGDPYWIPQIADLRGHFVEPGRAVFEWEDLSTVSDPEACHATVDPLFGPTPAAASRLPAEPLTWQQFKERASQLVAERKEPSRLIFRGQELPWRLETRAHRHRRFDIHRYATDDVARLHRHLSTLSQRHFRLTRNEDHSALLNLAQHHGYPTPLLDWTQSPYIAAFFAYRHADADDANRSKVSGDSDVVRIHCFDAHSWSTQWEPVNNIGTVRLTVSVHELHGFENPRMLPQQSVVMFSNVHNIEDYLEFKQTEVKHNKPYLWALDLPISDRDDAMRDLRAMGVTAAAMFPGIDGTCETLREVYCPPK